MKALSLWQPWASLIALGVKTIETRSWGTKYRGPLAIHAAARQPDLGAVGEWTVRLLGPERVIHRTRYPLVTRSVPLGAVVATCELVDCLPMFSADDELPTAWMPHVAESQGGDRHLCRWHGPTDTDGPMGRPTWVTTDIEGQRPYGDFTPGRWAWVLADITPIPAPIPARGRQQLFEWEPPAPIHSGQIGTSE